MSRKRALIIGGSLGGLIAAHLLRSIGWDAVIFERNAEDLVGRGAGLGTHQHLIDILRRVGIAFDDSMGVQVGKVLCLDRDACEHQVRIGDELLRGRRHQREILARAPAGIC